MRKIVVYELLSLNGVAEAPDSFFTDWDDMMQANLAAVIAAQDAVILGRRSYDEWAEFWPGSNIQPFATFINGVAKFVATSAPLQREWANATAVDGGLVEFVRDLKIRPGGDIGVHASISVAQALLAARRRRRAQARDRADDRWQRTKAARRVAVDSARIDPKLHLTQWLSACRLPHHPVAVTSGRDGGLTRGMIQGMTKKIGVSLRQELYDWAAREVEEGRAESVSALIAEGLELLEARAQLEAVVTELHREAGELDDQAKARLAEALAAADEAYRRHRGSSAGHAA